MAKHSPGGFHRNIKPISKYPIIFAGRNTHIAQVLTAGVPPEEAEANADLITAAPDMQEALEKIIAYADHCYLHPAYPTWYYLARDALQKSKGG